MRQHRTACAWVSLTDLAVSASPPLNVNQEKLMQGKKGELQLGTAFLLPLLTVRVLNSLAVLRRRLVLRLHVKARYAEEFRTGELHAG